MPKTDIVHKILKQLDSKKDIFHFAVVCLFEFVR